MNQRQGNAIPILYFAFVSMNSLKLITIVASITNTIHPMSNETDLQALFEIKNMIREDPLLVFSSWNHSVHFCNWKGVTCGPKHQRVTILDFSFKKLVGSLSPHVGNLTFLRTINLGTNFFHGPIPRDIERLFRLQHLVLANNSFQGQLPVNMTRWSNIKVINLNHNNLEGEIPAVLSSLYSLHVLVLEENHFTGPISASFGNLSTLGMLSFRKNNLVGSIPLQLGQLSKLQFLYLNFNNLTGTVPNQLYNISSLTVFVLVGNRLQGTLPIHFGLGLPKLEEFLIAGNQFSGPIPSSIANASKLTEFDVSFNSITGPMPKSLGNLNYLEWFGANANALAINSSGDELNNILTTLSNCSNLLSLYLSVNNFSGLLPHSIANLSTNLNYLDLSQNYYIYGSIPSGIGNLVNLLKFGINENMLSGNIPESIGKLTKLERLYMYTNEISGKIPFSIGNLTRLSLLNLAENKLEGRIPHSLGNCKSLQVFSLAVNNLNGTIPEQLFSLPSLSIGLYLGSNDLTGPIPIQVGNLRNLGTLDLSENKLYGGIPTSLGSIQVLETLSLEGNHLEGTIPASFNQLKGIQFLDLSRNNLSGNIPMFFGESSSLQNFNLSYNAFEGEVPNKGLFMNISAFSIVGNKKLCGGVTELQLLACPKKVLQKKKGGLNYNVIIPVITILLTVVVLLCVAIIVNRRRMTREQISSPLPLQNMYLKLSYAKLHQATNGFSLANLLGEGKYGSVFHGILKSTGQVVAVKVLKLEEHGGNRSFQAECEALRNIRHRNLVKIITSCSSTDFKQNDFKALVFEFMENGSLENWLYPRSRDEQQQGTMGLNLIQRLSIAIDVASALDYLHYRCEVAIIHCDLKPSNVLLDADFCAHVSDFGLAKIISPPTGISNNQQESSSIEIVGTIGYVAPEYGMCEEVSTQGDMYSYGMLILEMFIGKRPTADMFSDTISLSTYAKMSLPNNVMNVVDSRIISEEERHPSRRWETRTSRSNKLEACLASVLQVGVSCSVAVPAERMNARDVLVELHNIRNVFLN